jgi:hypothetical protein
LKPSAIIATDGNIMVYGNLNYSDPTNNNQLTIIRYNMGTSDRSGGAHTIINASVT